MKISNIQYKSVLPLIIFMLCMFNMPAISHAQSGSMYYDLVTPAPEEATFYNSFNTKNNTQNANQSPSVDLAPAGGSQAVQPAGGSQDATRGSGVNTTNTTNNATKSSGVVTTLTNPLKGVNSISDLILTFMKIISYLAVIFGVIMLMWVGLQFVLAQGNPEEIKKRSNQLLWVVVGIGVILGARILVSVMINTLQATGTINPEITRSAQNAINSQ